MRVIRSCRGYNHLVVLYPLLMAWIQYQIMASETLNPALNLGETGRKLETADTAKRRQVELKSLYSLILESHNWQNLCDESVYEECQHHTNLPREVLRDIQQVVLSSTHFRIQMSK